MVLELVLTERTGEEAAVVLVRLQLDHERTRKNSLGKPHQAPQGQTRYASAKGALHELGKERSKLTGLDVTARLDLKRK